MAALENLLYKRPFLCASCIVLKAICFAVFLCSLIASLLKNKLGRALDLIKDLIRFALGTPQEFSKTLFNHNENVICIL